MELFCKRLDRRSLLQRILEAGPQIRENRHGRILSLFQPDGLPKGSSANDSRAMYQRPASGRSRSQGPGPRSERASGGRLPHCSDGKDDSCSECPFSCCNCLNQHRSLNRCIGRKNLRPSGSTHIRAYSTSTPLTCSASFVRSKKYTLHRIVLWNTSTLHHVRTGKANKL